MKNIKTALMLFTFVLLTGSQCALIKSEPTLQEQLDSASGSVFVPSGVYVLTDTLTIPSGKGLVLDNNATIRNIKDSPTIRMMPESSLTGGNIQTKNNAAIILDGDGFPLSRLTRIQNVNITGWDWPSVKGTGILFYRTVTDQGVFGQGIYGVVVDNVSMDALEYGIRIVAENGEGNGLAVINANTFNNIYISNTYHAISIERDEAGCCRINGNRFSNITIQHKNSYPRSEMAIYNNGEYNQCTGVMIWDWPSGVGIWFDALSQHNKLEGTVSKWIKTQDDGTLNE